MNHPDGGDDGKRAACVAPAHASRDLREAIETGALRLHYQPIVSVDDEIVAVEALVRWAHPRRGLLLPAEFISVAEDTGLIGDLGAWVLRHACAHAATWRAGRRPDLAVSVNVSVHQLSQPEFVPVVESALTSTGLPADALCLEITETVLMHDPAAVAAGTLGDLREMGVRIAVDDFGTGYSSLVYLRHLPADTLKLDRFFVRGLSRTDKDTAIARSIIDLAHALGMTTTAEGVESTEQLAFLRALGCDHFQGFLWSRPVDADTTTDLLRPARARRDTHDQNNCLPLVTVGDANCPCWPSHEGVLPQCSTCPVITEA